ncbi:hypothetical protein [Tenacibaculum holothuriorum]|nr:hypothetical protein [Tenacibaculum holothuriorum]
MKSVFKENEMRFAMNIIPGGGSGTTDPDKPGGNDGDENTVEKK